MSWQLPELPFPSDALEPWISAETVEYHHDHLHRYYLEQLNDLVEGTEYERFGLEEIISEAGTDLVFEFAVQAWSHALYWQCLSPDGGGHPTGGLAEAIASTYGSFEHLREKFIEAAMAMPVPGWAWIVKEGDKSLSILTSREIDSPMAHGREVLLACDLWEHAYYLDYRADKRAYLDAFWGLINWDVVEQRYDAIP